MLFRGFSNSGPLVLLQKQLKEKRCYRLWKIRLNGITSHKFRRVKIAIKEINNA